MIIIINPFVFQFYISDTKMNLKQSLMIHKIHVQISYKTKQKAHIGLPVARMFYFFLIFVMNFTTNSTINIHKYYIAMPLFHKKPYNCYATSLVGRGLALCLINH